MKPDIQVENHGSIFLLRPFSEAGRIWLTEYLAKDAPYLGNAAAVEPRYVGAIVDGMIADGLEVE